MGSGLLAHVTMVNKNSQGGFQWFNASEMRREGAMRFAGREARPLSVDDQRQDARSILNGGVRPHQRERRARMVDQVWCEAKGSRNCRSVNTVEDGR